VKFIDEALITVQSGNGGSGCVSFRREKFIPRGGPDGGDGGRGGDVILMSTSHRRTLYPFRFKREFKAPNGSGGQGKQKTGKNGADLVIEVPAGTVVRDVETNQILKDFNQSNEVLIVARGGRGGKGNTHFKTSTHRTPRFAQPGEAGQILKLKLELKLLADVGIIGLPNAGKSTLIGAISSARPRVGAYPFTTLTPILGVVQSRWGEPFVVADIPGLIAGAHQGVGLGTRFLRHIERTRILIHLIDVFSIDPENPLDAYETVNRELALYSRALAKKPQVIVLNKLDLLGAPQRAQIFRSAIEGREDQDVISISAIQKTGIDRLIPKLLELLGRYHQKRQNAQV
jgi:GTP-binding protein